MSKYKDRLKQAHIVIAKLEAKIINLQREIRQLNQPDIFWLDDDSENGTDNIDCLFDFADVTNIGESYTIGTAKNLPDMQVKISGFDEDNNIVYEYL